MNLTKQQSTVLSEITKGAISAHAFHRMKGKEIFRVAHAIAQDDYVSIRLDMLTGWDKDNDTPVWDAVTKEGKLPRGTKPTFAFRLTDVEHTPKNGEYVILLDVDEEDNYVGVPAVVTGYARGKVNLTIWDDEKAEEVAVKVKPEDVLMLVGFARDYCVTQQLFNLLHDKEHYGLPFENIEQVINLLDAYEMTVYDWLDYAVAENPTKTALYRNYIKPNEFEPNGILWTMFEDGEKLKAKYEKRNGVEEPNFETVVQTAKSSLIKAAYAKVCEKAKLDEDEMVSKVSEMRDHLIELANSDKKQALVLKLLTVQD